MQYNTKYKYKNAPDDTHTFATPKKEGLTEEADCDYGKFPFEFSLQKFQKQQQQPRRCCISTFGELVARLFFWLIVGCWLVVVVKRE